MEVRPCDLGKRWQIATVRYRAIGTARFTMPPQQGYLGRQWAKGLDLPDDVAAATLPLMVDTTTPLVAGLGTAIPLTALVVCWFARFAPLPVLLTFLIAAFCLYLAVIGLPRRMFHRLHQQSVRWDELEALKGSRPLKTADETATEKKTARNTPTRLVSNVVEGLRGNAPNRPGDALELEFLRFAQDVVDIKGLSIATENEVRRVLRLTGDAVSALPTRIEENEIPGDLTGLSPDQLLARDNERKLQQRMHRLRDELAEMIHSLRSLLPTMAEDSLTAATDFGRFVTLAASIQSISAEGVSVGEARDELSRQLFPKETVTVTPATETPAPLQLGNRN